jgi:hypothetical protein
MTSIRPTLLALAAAMCFISSTHAVNLYSAGNTGKLDITDDVTASFNAGAGAGYINLKLRGYNTLDSDSFNIDIFHLFVNGTEVFSGTWALGGAGVDRILFNPNAGSAVQVNARVMDLQVPVTFVAGVNNVTFSYDSPTLFEGSLRAGLEGFRNEGWGMNSVSINGRPYVASVVPEPKTYALFATGLGCMGFFTSRRKSIEKT